MKKLLSLILVVVLSFTILPLNVFAATTNNSFKMVGDLDLDEEITDWDGVLLARYLAGWNVEVPDTLIFDIDGDGEITDWDGVMFDRHLAGWLVTTEIGKKLSFNITYLNTKNATNTNPTTLQYGNIETQLLELSVPYYTFEGWFVGSQKYTSIPANQNEDITLTAKWSPIEYDITYNNTNGATNNNPHNYNIETSTIYLNDLLIEGYIFEGWYDNENKKITSIPSGSHGEIILNAKWTPCDYTITYNNTQGATNNNVTGFNIESDTIFLLDLQRDGYTFNGWYKDGVKVTEISKGTIGNITLTANWTKIEYSITYLNVNGATNNNPLSYTIESNNISLADLSLSGYVFLGWYNENGQVTTIPQGSVGDIVLTAKWESLYNIIYTNTKSATNKNPTSYTANDGIIELVDLTKTGYTFDGWYEGDTKITHIDSTEKKDITLDARWTANQYTVTINGNGGRVYSSKIIVTYGEPMPNYSDMPTRRGYDFTGLYSSSGYKYYNSDLTSARTWNIASDTTLTAKWSEQPYQVTTKGPFLLNSSGEIENLCEYYFTAEETGSYYIQVYHSSTKCRGYNQYEGHWCCRHGFTISVDDENDEPLWLYIKGLTSGDYIANTFFNSSQVGTSTTDYLDFENDTRFEISFNVEKGKTYKILAQNTGRVYSEYSSDYEYNYNKNQSHNIASCYGNKAKYRVTKENGDIVSVCEIDKVHNVTYENTKNAENKNISKIAEGAKIPLQGLSKEGYVFDGWYLNGTKVTELSNIVEDVILTAKWIPNVYTATFYVDGQKVGSTTFTADDSVLIGSPEPPQKEHYTSRWEYVLELKDIDVFAKYTPIEYTITYENIGNSTNYNSTHYNIENGLLLSPLDSTGYDFVGWMNEDGELITAIPNGSFGNITLTAIWGDRTDFIIEFIDNTYDSIVEKIIYNVDSETITLPQLTDKSDHYFVGWYSGDVKYEVIPTGTFGDLKLVAKWASKDISYGSASVYNISMSGGSAYVQSISVSKSWDYSRKVWRVSVTVTVRINPRTSATYEVRLSGMYVGTVSFYGYEAYETQSRTVTISLSPGDY